MAPQAEPQQPGQPFKPSESHKLDLLQRPRPNTAALVAREGDAITITKGREVIQPFSYHSFEVGPIGITVHLQPDESFEQAYLRASVALEELYEAEFAIRLQSFREHVTQTRGTR